MSNNKYFPTIFLLAFFGSILVLLWYLFIPMLNAIIVAIILAGVFLPLHKLLKGKRKISNSLAAMITCIVVVLAIILPSLYIASQLTLEVLQVYEKQKEFFNKESISNLLGEDGVVLQNVNFVLEYFNYRINSKELVDFLIANGNEISQFILNYVQVWVTNTFSYTFSFFLDFIIMILVMYGILAEGKNLRRFLLYILPLNPYRSKTVLRKFNQMNYVTLVVNGLGGLIQGGLAGFAFLLCGFDSVLLLTFVMIILAFIPLLGISIIYIPATFFLLYEGSYFSATFLFIFCTIVALVVENIYKPKIIGMKVQVNSIFLLLSLIAGLSQFGVLGIFYGPIVITLFLSFSEFIKAEFTSTNKHISANLP